MPKSRLRLVLIGVLLSLLVGASFAERTTVVRVDNQDAREHCQDVSK